MKGAFALAQAMHSITCGVGVVAGSATVMPAVKSLEVSLRHFGRRVYMVTCEKDNGF